MQALRLCLCLQRPRYVSREEIKRFELVSARGAKTTKTVAGEASREESRMDKEDSKKKEA